MSTTRIFAQLAFERALGNAAIDALRNAMQDKAHFDRTTQWPARSTMSGYDIEAASAELAQVIEDRVRDVLDGPGLANIERGEAFYETEIVAMVVAAKAKRGNPG